jgi:hypothetical protein
VKYLQLLQMGKEHAGSDCVCAQCEVCEFAEEFRDGCDQRCQAFVQTMVEVKAGDRSVTSDGHYDCLIHKLLIVHLKLELAEVCTVA